MHCLVTAVTHLNGRWGMVEWRFLGENQRNLIESHFNAVWSSSNLTRSHPGLNPSLHGGSQRLPNWAIYSRLNIISVFKSWRLSGRGKNHAWGMSVSQKSFIIKYEGNKIIRGDLRLRESMLEGIWKISIESEWRGIRSSALPLQAWYALHETCSLVITLATIDFSRRTSRTGANYWLIL
jgi:hypothetical protein